MGPDGLAERPVAWRCEHCRKLQPASIASSIILINETGERWNWAGNVARKGRFMRRMVVCPPCKQKIVEGPLDEPGGQ